MADLRFPLSHSHRDFTSAHTIRVESGLSHVMEQYDRNFKVQQLMGSKHDIPSPSNKNSSAHKSSSAHKKKA